MNGTLHAFMTHLHLYETAAGLLIALAVAGLIVLAWRYSVTGPRPTRAAARAARRRG